jgi:hypothetical protein
MKKTFLIFTFVSCIFCSCYEQKKESTVVGKNTENAADVPYDELANTITEDPFQDSVNVLQESWLSTERQGFLKKIENIASKSDGEASEYMDVTLVSMFKQKPAPLITYLYHNRNSELYNVLTRGLGMELVVYDKAERISMKGNMKEKALELSKGKLTKSQVEFVDQLFIDVVPEKYD